MPLLDEVGRFTEAVQDSHGEVTVEWVLAGGQPHVVDYSVLGADPVTLSADGLVLVSAGTACGPLLRLDDDELLARLSIGPAVSVDATDSVLGHLAILLREAGVPAVISPDLPAASEVLISDGTLTLATDAEEPA